MCDQWQALRKPLCCLRKRRGAVAVGSPAEKATSTVTVIPRVDKNGVCNCDEQSLLAGHVKLKNTIGQFAGIWRNVARGMCE